MKKIVIKSKGDDPIPESNTEMQDLSRKRHEAKKSRNRGRNPFEVTAADVIRNPQAYTKGKGR